MLCKSLALALLAAFGASAQTSNVQAVKGWKRTHVMGLPGGGLRDPTGTIAEGQRQAAAEAAIEESSNIVSAAAYGLTNALERLWGAADATNRFTDRLYIAADNDAPGSPADAAFQRQLWTLEKRGVPHKVIRAPAGIKDMNGRKACVVAGSDVTDAVRSQAPKASIEARDDYGQCLTSLLIGDVDAVAAGDAILTGLATVKGNGYVQVVGAPFGEER